MKTYILLFLTLLANLAWAQNHLKLSEEELIKHEKDAQEHFKKNNEKHSIALSTKISNLKEVVILCGNVEVVNPRDSINYLLGDAALNLALKLADGQYLNLAIRDSLANKMLMSGKQPKLDEIAREINANFIAFLNISVFEGIVKASVTLVSPDNSIEQKGQGYAFANFRTGSKEKPVYDPAILVATQRALADAIDENLYSHQEGKFNVKPVELITVTGIYYDDNKITPHWKIFKDQTSSSYDACENILEVLSKSPNFAICDMATRDTLYTLFGMHAPENYAFPTPLELEALSKFDINTIITGKLERTTELTCTLTLYLCKLENGNLVANYEASSVLNEDSILTYRKILKELSNKLLSKLLDNKKQVK